MAGKYTARGFATPCLVVASKDVHGYAQLKDGAGHRRKGHHVAWEWVHGRIPPHHELHHRCEQKDCVRSGHLMPVTRREHMQLDGRSRAAAARGRRQAKLSDDQVRRLCERLAAGEITQTQAATEYGVSKQLVNGIVRGRSRAAVGGPRGAALDGRKLKARG